MRALSAVVPVFLLLPVLIADSSSGRVPVLVELFTSEGCSSCPPADRLLTYLDGQPIPGVEVIALSEHVDYWNHLGWSDPYSAPAFRFRQEQYAQVFKTESVYTPQMIINGQAELVGSDSANIGRQIVKASRWPRASVRLERSTVSARQGDAPGLRVEIAAIPAASKAESMEIILAITESKLQSSVSAGENAGHTLVHTAVVRSITKIADLDPKKAAGYTADLQVPLGRAWNRENLRAVLFVQGGQSRRIIGAASCSL